MIWRYDMIWWSLWLYLRLVFTGCSMQSVVPASLVHTPSSSTPVFIWCYIRRWKQLCSHGGERVEKEKQVQRIEDEGQTLQILLINLRGISSSMFSTRQLRKSEASRRRRRPRRRQRRWRRRQEEHKKRREREQEQKRKMARVQNIKTTRVLST